MSTSHQLGKYRLIAELGHGGMADVFLALVEGPAGSGFAKLAVVKRLRANLLDDPEFVTMLVDEARITARLNHPNVVQMLEVGVQDEEYFLAMEYLDGQPFHRVERRAARNGAGLSRDATAAILLDVLAGLQHAHDLVDYDGTPLNIVHRDITPHNIFLTYDGQVKVMDFGIAKAAGRAHETQHGVVKGKVRYMSPEQASGQALDRRADIFAVGLLLWQAATGTRFWGERDDFVIVQALIAGDYQPSPKAVLATVPDELDRICRKALARDPAERYATALDMKTDLEAFLGGVGAREKRQVIALTNEMFAKERKDLRTIVEKTVRGSSLGASPATLLARTGSSSISIPAVSKSMRPSALSVQTQTSASNVAPPAVTRRVDRLLASIGAAAACLALGVVAVTVSGEAVPQRSPAAAAPDLTPLAASPIRGARHLTTTSAPLNTIVTAHFIPVAAPAQAPAPASAAPGAVEPAVARPAPAATIPSIQPARARAVRLNVDTNDPW